MKPNTANSGHLLNVFMNSLPLRIALPRKFGWNIAQIPQSRLLSFWFYPLMLRAFPLSSNAFDQCPQWFSSESFRKEMRPKEKKQGCVNKEHKFNFRDFDQCFRGQSFIKLEARNKSYLRSWETALEDCRNLSVFDLWFNLFLFSIYLILHPFPPSARDGFHEQPGERFPEQHGGDLSAVLPSGLTVMDRDQVG